jgi:hypothetical protein
LIGTTAIAKPKNTASLNQDNSSRIIQVQQRQIHVNTTTTLDQGDENSVVSQNGLVIITIGLITLLLSSNNSLRCSTTWCWSTRRPHPLTVVLLNAFLVVERRRRVYRAAAVIQ